MKEINRDFQKVKQEIIGKLKDYLDLRCDVSLQIVARDCGVTLFSQGIEESKYRLARVLKSILSAKNIEDFFHNDIKKLDVDLKLTIPTNYQELFQLIQTFQEAHNALIKGKLFYSGGELKKTLEECIKAIPENLQSNTEPMVRDKQAKNSNNIPPSDSDNGLSEVDTPILNIQRSR